MVFDPLLPVAFVSGERLLVPVLAGDDVQPPVPINVGHRDALAAPQINGVLAERNFVRPRGFQPGHIPRKVGRGHEGKHYSTFSEEGNFARR